MQPIRILLLCSSKMALPTMQQLHFLGVLSAVVVPAHCEEMVEQVQYLLQQTNTPVVVVDKLSYTAQINNAIDQYQATMGLMVTFSFLLPASVYKKPVHGFYNVHPGPLPQYRGADPVFQQIKNREKQAGVTIHQLDDSFDTGPVVMQEMIRLLPTDTYGMLTGKLAQVAARLVLTLLKLYGIGVAIPSKPQSQQQAKYYRKHTATDVAIRWEQMTDVEITAVINACNPWNKGATTQLNGQVIRLLEAEPAEFTTSYPQAAPGTILCFQDQKMIVSAANQSAISVSLVYSDEGFTNAGRLSALGILPGQQFQSL